MTRNDIAARVHALVFKHFDTSANTPSKPITDETEIAADLHGDSLDRVEIIMEIEDQFDVEVPDDALEDFRTVGEVIDWLAKRLDQIAETCIACDVPFKDGDRVLSDASGGALHVACCGPERESYTNAAGEPLGPDDPIPEGYVWRPWPAKAVA